MKSMGHNSHSNYSIQSSRASRLSRITQVLALTAASCSLAIFALSTDSFGQSAPSDFAADHAGWVQAPGALVRPECVHEIPNGGTVEIGDDGQPTGDVTMNGSLIAHYEACAEAPVITRPRGRTDGIVDAPGTGRGWVEASQYEALLSSSDNIDYVGGSWTVPKNPSVNGALIYLFNGIEPTDGNWILQPVLQYGLSPAGGGNWWAIASWLVGSNGYIYHSPLVAVTSGNSISGFTEITSISGNTLYWYVQAKDTSTGFGSWIRAHGYGLHWTWGFAGVLEAYNVTSCANFPSSGRAVFEGSVIDHGFPSFLELSPLNWYGAFYSYGGPSCHFAVVAGSDSTLDF